MLSSFSSNPELLRQRQSTFSYIETAHRLAEKTKSPYAAVLAFDLRKLPNPIDKIEHISVYGKNLEDAINRVKSGEITPPVSKIEPHHVIPHVVSIIYQSAA